MQDLFRAAEFVSFKTSGGITPQDGERLQVELPAFYVTRVGGFAVGNDFTIESRSSTPIAGNHTVDQFQDALGEWMAVGQAKRNETTEYVVFGDSSGYCPVFFAKYNNRIIVADTFMGAVHGLKYFGATPTLDLAHYIATLLPSHPHFDNPSVRRTMCAEIEILGIEDALWISEEGMQIVDRNLLSSDAHQSYEQLLERGSQLVRNSIKQLSRVNGLQKVLSLSGGVDSRLVLALINSSGLTDQFQLSSVDPRVWKNKNTRDVVERDVEIADSIRTMLGLEWSAVGHREFLQFDFQDSMNFHQSYKSNFAHSFAAPPGHTVHDDLKITFRGGGGELLRTTLTGERIAKQIHNRTWKTSETQGFTDWYMSRFPMLNAERPLVEEYMTETFNAVSGESITQKLNHLYRHTRNRTHFGHVRQSGSTNNYAFHPLSNQHFINASHLLEFKERASGQIVKDLFNLNSPSLLDLPFENPESTKEIANPIAQNRKITNNDWAKSFDKLKATRAKSTARNGWTNHERLIDAPYDKIQSSIAFATQGMKLLEDLVDPGLQKSLRRVNARAFELTQVYSSRVLGLSTKIASALDVFVPSIPAGNHTQFFTRTVDTETQTSISKVRIQFPTKINNGWHNQVLPEFSPTLRVEDGAFTLDIGLLKPATIPCEFAVYLYKDNKRVDKSWYRQETQFSFELMGSGSYYAQVFYRANSSRRTSLGIKTNELVID